MAVTNNKNKNVAGDLLGTRDFFAADGDNNVLAAQVRCYVDGTVSAGKAPSRLEFWTSTSAGVLTKAGTFLSNGLLIRAMAAPVAKTTSATLTAAEVLGGSITSNQAAGGAATYTLPLGSDLSAAFASTPAVGDSFDFTVTNISTVGAEDATVQGNTGTTLIGNGFVPSFAANSDIAFATFRFRNTGAGTWDIFRI